MEPMFAKRVTTRKTKKGVLPSLNSFKLTKSSSSQKIRGLFPAELVAGLKAFLWMLTTSFALSQITRAMVHFRISVSCSYVNPIWWSSLSYQKRSPMRRFLNCRVRIQVKVKPNTLPGIGSSRMATHMSMSNGEAYTFFRLIMFSLLNVSEISPKVVTGFPPQASRNLTYPGRP